MQNLLIKQEPEGATNTDLHEFQKNCHWNYRITKFSKQTHFIRYQYKPN